jgi:hypothetical protein
MIAGHRRLVVLWLAIASMVPARVRIAGGKLAVGGAVESHFSVAELVQPGSWRPRLFTAADACVGLRVGRDGRI